MTAVACKPIEIYGLFEAVHPTLNRHTATIRCASDCSYIRIPIQTYLDQLSRDPKFGVLSLKHLSLLVERILNENEYLHKKAANLFSRLTVPVARITASGVSSFNICAVTFVFILILTPAFSHFTM